MNPLLLFAALALPARPAQQVPTDTLRVVRGLFNQPFAWGTLMLRNGQRVQGYLPATTLGLDNVVAYYLRAPDSTPAPRPKLLSITKVQWMRVQGQYSELLGTGKHEPRQLAARRQQGAVELFVVKTLPSPILSAMGPSPVMSAPVTDNSAERLANAVVQWYLRRPNGSVLVVTPGQFARQVSAFLADDADLARRVAAAQEGYRLPDLESVIQQYNRRATTR